MQELTPEFLKEYDAFVKGHAAGGFMQTIEWGNLKKKNGWNYEIVVTRDEAGKINGSMLILIKKTPFLSSAYLYCPRGPVCDFKDKETLGKLFSEADKVVKKYKGCALKVDPYVLADDEETVEMIKSFGFDFIPHAPDLTSAQTRYNYMLTDIAGKTEEEVFMSFKQKTRYNVRVAQKHGVECKICGEEALDDFYHLMKITGERDGFTVRPKQYFREMIQELGDWCRLYMCYYEGKAVSGAITTQCAGKTCYVYGASDNAYRNVMPNYLMQWEMIKWAIEGGCYQYDFQGICFWYDENHPMYGVYRFKKGFNGEIVEFAGDFDKTYRKSVDKTIKLMVGIRKKLLKLKKKAKKLLKKG